MPGLSLLALEHIVSTITPQSSFAVLLASSTWEELHSLIEVRPVVGRVMLDFNWVLAGLRGGQMGRSVCLR